MQQYVIIARDGSDEDALKRRMNVRSNHLENVKTLRSHGNYIVGGAMLNSKGNMCGSVMIVQFETNEEFQKWYDQEPYIKQGVWEMIEVQPFRVAMVE